MKYLYLTLTIFLFQLNTTNAQKSVTFEEKQPTYISITAVHTSEIKQFQKLSNFDEAGYLLRYVETISEIHPSIYIEKIITDIEGGASQLFWSKRIDLEEILKLYRINQEFYEVKFLKWDKRHKLYLEMKGEVFILSNLQEGGEIKVEIAG